MCVPIKDITFTSLLFSEKRQLHNGHFFPLLDIISAEQCFPVVISVCTFTHGTRVTRYWTHDTLDTSKTPMSTRTDGKRLRLNGYHPFIGETLIFHLGVVGGKRRVLTTKPARFHQTHSPKVDWPLGTSLEPDMAQ